MVVNMLSVMSLVFPPAAVAALMATLYFIYPYPLIQGFTRFGSYFLAGLRRKFIEAGGITFSYYEREATPSPQQTTDDGGVAAPPPVTLVFVHGFSASKIMWTSMVPHFPSEWRIVMMDMPGHGESSFISGEDYSSKGMARKLHDFIHTLELRNVHLIGVSMGSLISTVYTSLYPEEVESLSIMCIPVAHKLPEGVKTKFFEELEKGNILVMPQNAKEFEEMLQLVLYNPTPYIFHKRLLDTLVKMQQNNYDYMREIMQNLTSDDDGNDPKHIYSMANSIKAPTLVLWGDNDQVCHPSGAAVAGKLIKGSQVVVVKKCGHAMTLDQPEKCSKLIRRFISGSAELSSQQ